MAVPWILLKGQVLLFAECLSIHNQVGWLTKHVFRYRYPHNITSEFAWGMFSINTRCTFKNLLNHKFLISVICTLWSGEVERQKLNCTYFREQDSLNSMTCNITNQIWRIYSTLLTTTGSVNKINPGLNHSFEACSWPFQQAGEEILEVHPNNTLILISTQIANIVCDITVRRQKQTWTSSQLTYWWQLATVSAASILNSATAVLC